MDHFKVIAFTHSNVGLDNVSKLFISEDEYADRLVPFKEKMQLDELMYLATCNRAEFYFSTYLPINNHFLRSFFGKLFPDRTDGEIRSFIEQSRVVDGIDAVRHLFQVSSSLDSLVVGEREILSQFRNSYTRCKELGLTGDFLNLAVRKTVETAKKVFTETDIAGRPISVVNLAFRELYDRFLSYEADIAVVGAGVTNKAMLLKMKKHGYKNFHIFNRTLTNAESLAKNVGGKAYPLSALKDFNIPVQAVITCTGAPDIVISEEMFARLTKGVKGRIPVVDLAVPNDLDSKIPEKFDIDLIEVKGLKEIADKNMLQRKKAVVNCERIIDLKLKEFDDAYRERQIELAMREVPQQIKSVREKAVQEVFAKQMAELDDNSKDVVGKMLAYMEKKVNAITMKKAKQIMLERQR